MAIECAIVTGTVTGSGTADFTSSGFGTQTCAIILHNLANTGSNPAGAARPGFGFYDGTRQVSASSASSDSTASANAYRVVSTSYAMCSWSATSSRYWSASSITDGIRLTWVSGDSLSASLYVTVLLIKGTTNAYCSSQALTGTGATNITAPGFEANAVIAGSGGEAAGVNSTAMLSLGAGHINSSSVISQGCIAWSSVHAADPTVTNEIIRDDGIACQISNDSVDYVIELTNSNPNGFQAQPTSNPGGDLLLYLALETPNADDVNVSINNAKTSTGTQAYTGVGFTPLALLLAPSRATAVNTLGSTANFACGVSNGTTDAGYCAVDEDNQGTTDTEAYYHSTALFHLRSQVGSTSDTASTPGANSLPMASNCW